MLYVETDSIERSDKMPESSGFFDAILSGGSYDRVYSSADFDELFKMFFTSGVRLTNGTDLKVNAKTGLTVTIKAGRAFLDGKWYNLPEDTDLTLPANTTSNPLKYAICITKDQSQRKCTRSYRTGDMTPVRSSSKYELIIAIVTVGVGVSSISQSNIQDTRADSEYCGLVQAAVQDVDFTELFTQFSAQMQEQLSNNQQQFDTWFSEVKGQLTEDVAGNLQNEINDLEEKLTQGLQNVTKSHYRVGDIIMTLSPDDPSEKYGGSWEIWGVNKMPRGVAENSAVNTTGGADSRSIAHIHSVPSHNHTVPSHKHISSFGYDIDAFFATNKYGDTVIAVDTGGNISEGYRFEISSGRTTPVRLSYTEGVSLTTAGKSLKTNSGGGTINTVPAYITCYFWRKIS